MNKSNKPNWNARRREFWEQLIKAMNAKSQLTTKFCSRNYHYLSRKSGFHYIDFAFIVSEGRKTDTARVEIYLKRPDLPKNDQTFDQLLSQRKQIESSVGLPLSWERLDHRKTSRIAYRCDADFSTCESCDRMVDSLSDIMVKFENVFGVPDGPLAGITI